MEMWAEHRTGRRKSMAKAQEQEWTWRVHRGGQLYLKCMKKYIMWPFRLFNASMPEPCAGNTAHRIQTTRSKTGK